MVGSTAPSAPPCAQRLLVTILLSSARHGGCALVSDNHCYAMACAATCSGITSLCTIPGSHHGVFSADAMVKLRNYVHAYDDHRFALASCFGSTSLCTITGTHQASPAVLGTPDISMSTSDYLHGRKCAYACHASTTAQSSTAQTIGLSAD